MGFVDVTTVGGAILGSVLLGAAINFWIGTVAGRRDVPVARVYKWLAYSTGALCLVVVFQYLAPTLAAGFILEVLYNFFNLLGATLALLFVVVYTGNRDRLTRRRVALFAVEPLLFLIVLATNPVHGQLLAGLHIDQIEGLATIEYGTTPLMGVHLLYITTLSVATQLCLGWFYFRARNVYRKQTLLIFLGSLSIPVAAILYSSGVTPLNLVPLALILNGLIVWVALFKYDFLDVVPLAADLLVEEMSDAVVVVGTDGDVLDTNVAAERLFDTETSVVGQPLTAILPRLETALHEEEPLAHLVNGEPRRFDPNVTPIHDQYGINRGKLIVLHDVTAQLRRQAKLERQNARLDQFASVVSHDLRNPLGIAEGYVELAREENDVTHLDRTVDALDRMGTLIDDLLTLARNGQSVGKTTSVSLHSVAEAAWRNVDADVTFINEADGVVEADEQRLQQLFENLFRNAVEHTEDDVVIRVGRSGDGFYVEDNGPGVPPADRKTVFEYGHTSTPSGTGLGLAIVQSIADAHSWSVSLLDGTGGGARFKFSGVTSPPPRS